METDYESVSLSLVKRAQADTVKAIENLEQLTRLEELWLGKNKIRSLEVSSNDPMPSCFELKAH